MAIPWILIAIGLTLALLLVAVLIMHKNKKLKPDYQTWFYIGITWVAIGLPLKNTPLFIIGAVLLISSLVNKDKWEQNKKVDWNKLSDKDKKVRVVLIIVLGILVLLGVIALYLVEKGIL